MLLLPLPRLMRGDDPRPHRLRLFPALPDSMGLIGSKRQLRARSGFDRSSSHCGFKVSRGSGEQDSALRGRAAVRFFPVLPTGSFGIVGVEVRRYAWMKKVEGVWLTSAGPSRYFMQKEVE